MGNQLQVSPSLLTRGESHMLVWVVLSKQCKRVEDLMDKEDQNKVINLTVQEKTLDMIMAYIKNGHDNHNFEQEQCEKDRQLAKKRWNWMQQAKKSRCWQLLRQLPLW